MQWNNYIVKKKRETSFISQFTHTLFNLDYNFLRVGTLFNLDQIIKESRLISLSRLNAVISVAVKSK